MRTPDRWTMLAAGLLAVLIAAAPALAEDAAPSPKTKEDAQLTPDAPVAVVNGTPITKGEFDRSLRAYMANFQRMAGAMHGKVPEPNDQMKSEVLDQLVDRELLYEESTKFPVPDAAKQVDEEFKKIQARFPDAETFKNAYEGEGLTEKSLRDLLDHQVSVRHYVESQLMPKVSVSDEDVAKFYEENKEKFAVPEQVRASHILIRVEKDAKPEEKEAARKKAQEIRSRVAGGEDFAEVAKKLSEDPGSGPKGGDLGFFTRDRMVAPFSEAAFGLKVGEVSDVVETPYGFHVIKLTDRKKGSQKSLDEVKEQIAGYLKAQALDRVVRERVAELRKDAKVDVVAPHL